MNKKWLIVPITALQVLFIAVISIVNFEYTVLISEKFATVSTAKPAQMMAAVDTITEHILSLIGYEMITFLVIGTLMWSLTNYVVSGKSLIRIVTENYLRSIIVMLVMYVAAALSIQNFDSVPIYVPIAAVSLLAYYLLVLLAMPPVNIKLAFRQGFYIATRKAYITLPLLLLNMAIIAGLTYLMSVTVNMAFIIVFFTTLLFVTAIVTARFVYCIVVQKLYKQTFKH